MSRSRLGFLDALCTGLVLKLLQPVESSQASIEDALTRVQHPWSKPAWGFRLCRGVCACSTASQAPDVLGHIWTKQHTIAMRLVPQSSTESLALTFKWDGKACRQKEPDPEVLAWLLAVHQSGAGNSGCQQWGEYLALLSDPHQATGDSALWRTAVAGKSLTPLGTLPASEEASSEG